jgi:hypothetical protein
MPEINGKRVEFKTRLTNRQKWGIIPLVGAVEVAETMKAKLEAITWDDLVMLFTTLIKEWDFDGSPDDPAVYDDLDFPTEIVPLFQATFGAMGDLQLSNRGEAESGRT